MFRQSLLTFQAYVRLLTASTGWAQGDGVAPAIPVRTLVREEA
jgi:hypothetical protein